MNIMIVDDEKLLRKGFRNMTDWSSKGINVIGEAMNGIDALEQIAVLRPDVVITDIKMPLMDGVALTKQIKHLYPHISVIILSGYDDYEYVRDSLKSGASDYLLKATIDIDEIYEALQRIKMSSKEELFSITTSLDDSSKNITIPIDKSQITKYLELHQFEDLKHYLSGLLDDHRLIPTPYLQDILRDLFFFIQYTLDQFGTLSKSMKERKYINSACVNLITNNQAARDWLSVILDEMAKHCIPLDSKYKSLVKQVVSYIEKYYMQSISLSHVAEEFYINKNYLCDIFKAETHSTINEYITKLRIEKAKALMRDSSYSLMEISDQVGYHNHSYFDRVFRKKTGISPSEYLKLYR